LSSRLAWSQPDAAAWWANYRLKRNKADRTAETSSSGGEPAETR